MSVHYNITANNDDFKRKFAEVRSEIRNSEVTAQNASSNIQSSIKKMAAGIGGLFAVQMGQQVVNDIQRIRGEFQQLEIAFTTMLGSKNKADDLMRQAVTTAAKTPFDLNQVASGYKQLLAYGIGVEKLNDTLVTLGDVASGVGAPLNDIVYLYGTLNASGRVALMDIRQFAGRGIPIYEELAKVLGIAKDRVNDFAGAGKISFEHVEQAFKNMTSEGGRFDSLMEKQSASIVGLKANLGDAVDTARNDLGKKLQPLFESTLKAQIHIAENYEDIGKTILGLAIAYGSYKAVLITVSAVEKLNMQIVRQAVLERKLAAIGMKNLSKEAALYMARTKTLSIAKQGLGKTMKSLLTALKPNPYVLLGTAVAGLTFTVYKLATAETAAEVAAKSLTKAHEERTRKIDEERSKTEDLISKLKDETLTRRERQTILADLQKMYPSLFGNLDIEKAKYLNLAESIRQVNELLDVKTRIQLRDEIQTAENLRKRLTDGTVSLKDRSEANSILGIGWGESVFIDGIRLAKALEKHIEGLKDQENDILLASYNAVSNEEKRNRLIVERNKLQDEYNSISKIDTTFGGEFAKNSQMEQIEKRILLINDQIKQYGNNVETVVTKNKSYWEEEKKKADEALAALTSENTQKEWSDARAKVLAAQKELSRYDVSSEKVEKKDAFLFSELTDENINKIIQRVKDFNTKRQEENKKAITDQQRAEEEARIQYFIDWGNFEQKKNALIDKYVIEAKKVGTKAEKDNLFKSLMEELNNLAIGDFKNSINFADIFSNIDEKSVGAIQILRDKLAKYIEQAANSMTPEQLKPLSDALIGMDNVLKEKKPSLGLSESIATAKNAYKDLKDAEEAGLSDENIQKYKIAFKDAMASVASQIQNTLGHFNDFGNIAVDLIGNLAGDEAGDIANDILGIAVGAGQAGVGVAKLFSGDIIGGAKDLAKGISQVVSGIVNMNDKAKERNIEDLQAEIDKLKDSYDALAKEINKAYSQDASKLIEQSNVMLKQRQIALKQQIAEENAKKKTDKNRIKEWEKEYDEISALIEENKEKAVDAIFGQDVKSAISDFTNAYVSAWGAGEDKIKSTKDAVAKMIRGVITEMINADFAPTVEKLREKINYFLSDGIIDSYEQSQLDKIIEAETSRIDNKYRWGDKYMVDGEEQGQATYGAYEKITQDQADRIDGKLTGVHMNTTQILETNKGIKSTADETYKLIFLQVEHLEKIKNNTGLLIDTNKKLDKVIENTNKL